MSNSHPNSIVIVAPEAPDPLDVLSTVQPTPTAAGNTTNKNTVFKDPNGDTWIVDSNGDAIKAGIDAASLPGAPIEERDVVSATANMTSHTLPDTPIGKVIVTRNGIDISDAWSFTGAVGTYTASLNYDCTIDAGNKLIFHYEKAAV